jgi:hypothetical protein
MPITFLCCFRRGRSGCDIIARVTGQFQYPNQNRANRRARPGIKATADFWRVGALLKIGEEEAGGAEVEEETGLESSGVVGSVGGAVG